MTLEVLVADDDDNVLRAVADALSSAGHQVSEARDGAEAVRLLSSRVFDLAICDVEMPKLGGIALLRLIRQDSPATAVVIMTSHGRISDVLDSAHDGAIDYVAKPFDPEEFTRNVVQRIAQQRALRKRFETARPWSVGRPAAGVLVAESAPMAAVAEKVAILAESGASVFITGERGTGKELVARAIHAQGVRREGPLVVMDGAVLPDVIADSERSWVSDDACPRDAWMLDAANGTLVLDGIESVPLTTQARLVHAIDEPWARARRAEGGQPRGVRLVTLSREEYGGRPAAGPLLDGLWYRLAGVRLHVPPLRARREDLRPLVTLLLRELHPSGSELPELSPAAWEALTHYPFPGNVRELRWVLEHALAMSDGGPIDVIHLPTDVGKR